MKRRGTSRPGGLALPQMPPLSSAKITTGKAAEASAWRGATAGFRGPHAPPGRNTLRWGGSGGSAALHHRLLSLNPPGSCCRTFHRLVVTLTRLAREHVVAEWCWVGSCRLGAMASPDDPTTSHPASPSRLPRPTSPPLQLAAVPRARDEKLQPQPGAAQAERGRRVPGCCVRRERAKIVRHRAVRVAGCRGRRLVKTGLHP